MKTNSYFYCLSLVASDYPIGIFKLFIYTFFYHTLIYQPLNFQNNTECLATYDSYPRGVNCYCTNFEGCYHQHFQVTPAVKVSEGLFPGKDTGVHDYDYYVEIAVTNHAQLVTILRKKVYYRVSE